MINRRHIRVKVMQSVYAMIKSYDDDVLKEEKFIKYSIKRMFDLYVLLPSKQKEDHLFDLR